MGTMFSFKATPDAGGEPLIIEAGMRDVRMWEKTHKGRSMGMIGNRANMSATILFELAFSAARRQGLVPAITEDVFADSYEVDILGKKELAELKGEPYDEEADESEEADEEEGPTPAGA